MGKMIDAQSIVVASTATRRFNHEGDILRYVFFHSVAGVPRRHPGHATGVCLAVHGTRFEVIGEIFEVPKNLDRYRHQYQSANGAR